MFKSIHIIVNPASGMPRPILHIFNEVFTSEKINWSVSVTKEHGDAQYYAQQALKEDVDVIAVYGGDGTVREVASKLIGKKTPMLILPGGTANLFSVELGISTDLTKICRALLKEKYKVQATDMAESEKEHFILRFSTGFEADIIHKTDRSMKNKVGLLAYALSGFQAILEVKPKQFNIVIDGEKVETKGLSCIIANSGNLGLPGITLSPKISVTDGLLDVIVIRNSDLKKLFSFDFNDNKRSFITEFFQHWQDREVSVSLAFSHRLHGDGEVRHGKSMKAKNIPRAVNIILPKIK